MYRILERIVDALELSSSKEPKAAPAGRCCLSETGDERWNRFETAKYGITQFTPVYIAFASPVITREKLITILPAIRVGNQNLGNTT